MKDQNPPPNNLDAAQQEDAASEVNEENIKSVSPPAQLHTEMRRRSVCNSAVRKDSSARPSLSPSALYDDASDTDNERAEPEEESPTTSSENSDLLADNPLDGKSRRFQCEHCEKSYAHNKDLNRHNKTSVCATIRLSDIARNAALSSMPMTAFGVRISTPTSAGHALVKMYQCPRCRGDFSIKFSAQRHIEKSCWKVCDECCASGNDNCDANKSYRADKLKCSACDSKGFECTKLTEAKEGDLPVEVWRMPKDAPSEDKDVKISGHAAGKKRRGIVSMSSDSKPAEVPHKKAYVSKSIFWKSHFNDDEPAQSNFHPLNQANKRNGLRGPSVVDRNHGFGSGGDIHPIEVGNPAILQDVFNNDGSQATGSLWHTNLAPQQIRALRLPQPWISEERSTIQGPMQGASSNDQFHAQSLPQSLTPKKIPRENPNTQPLFREHQHRPYDGQYGDYLRVPNNMSPSMASSGHQRSLFPVSIHRYPSSLRQASDFSNSGEYRSLPDFQFPNTQQSGDTRRYSAPGNFAYDQGFHEKFPVFRPSGQFSSNPAPLSTPDETLSYPSATDHRAISANMMPMALSSWRPGWNLQQVFGHPDRAERADDFDFDPRNIFKHSVVMPFNFDGQNEHIRPAAAPSITIQESSNSPPSSSIGIQGRRAGVRRSRRREEFKILEDDTIDHSSSRRCVSITDEGKSSSMVPIASTGTTCHGSNIKIGVNTLPAYQRLTAPVFVTPPSIPTPTVSDPLITLKIKGLEDGATDQNEALTTIVMRRSQKFGPILNAYCEERGKRYLFDWNFIYWYATPNTDDLANLSGQALEWEMTPNDFHPTEKERHCDIKDNDIIELVQGKPERMYAIEAINKNHRFNDDGNSQHFPIASDRVASYEGQANYQAIDDTSDVQEFRPVDHNLLQENERLRNENQSLDRLQLAYDGIRHAYERKCTENQTLLREIERLRG